MDRMPLYLDFATGEVKEFTDADSIPASVVRGVFPVNYIVINTSNTDPASELGYGTWSLLGSATVGATTIYYFKRTA